MSRYYFHLREGLFTLLDDSGTMLPNLQAARDRALKEARALMSADTHDGSVDLNHAIDVVDERGKLIHSLRFADAVNIVQPQPLIC